MARNRWSTKAVCRSVCSQPTAVAHHSSLVLNLQTCLSQSQQPTVGSRAGQGGAVKISREELYRRVWETPVTHVAKEFDISDVGLAKACRRLAIPLPPVGYWAKFKHGKSGARPPLPKLDTWG